MYLNPAVIRVLRHKWALAAACGIGLWLAVYFWLRIWWAQPNPNRWLAVSGIVLVYLLWTLWIGLGDNHRPDEKELLPALGLGNILSISRGFILVIFCGFLFSPWPDVGWRDWLPGLIYTLAVLPDFVDGLAARLTDHVTQLGETLDMTIDSIAVLSVSLLSVQYGQVPWWYLPVGLARYIFLAGIWLRQKLGLPVYDLPFSVRRRGYAGLTMGLFFVILYPIFRPPGTHIAATVFAIYLLGGFVWDWLLTVGWLPSHPGEGYLRVEDFIQWNIPLVLRLILLVWGIANLGPALASQPASTLLWAEAIVNGCLILGIAGRSTAIAALVIIGLSQTAAPLDGWQTALIVLHTNLLFLGTGRLSLWPIENWLIFHRVGDPRNGD